MSSVVQWQPCSGLQNLGQPPRTLAASRGFAGGVVLELPLGDFAATFDLEMAVCSHGMFMMAPNHWDSLSKTFQRPLYLDLDDIDGESSSVNVRISQPAENRQSLIIRVLDAVNLLPQQEQSLMNQVRRMLRLSEEEDRNVRKFQTTYGEAKERGFGRVFRSPTLFEDMVKCILLCNCQWSRTLSMARALCDIQLDLQCNAFNSVNDKPESSSSDVDRFPPKTPAKSEGRKQMRGLPDLADSDKTSAGVEANVNLQSGEKLEFCSNSWRGNFPSPRQIASLDEKFLINRCSLGYRAIRILNLAQGIVGGRIQLKQLEDESANGCFANYTKLAEQLKEIKGFGPFTRANVLMCLGFYHVIPIDSETIRHLKQVHGRKSTAQTIQRDVEAIYGKYEPFQFLVYWSEIWSFYEGRFGKMSKLPQSQYKLITAANLKKSKAAVKRIKTA